MDSPTLARSLGSGLFPSESLNRVYRTAAGSTATVWEVAQDRHAVALAARPAEYERRVLGFLDRALLARPGESP